MNRTPDYQRLVVVESPYAGDVERNLAYLRAAMRDCFSRGEAPYASHALYTQPGVLDDNDPAERSLGIQAGFLWAAHAHARVFYLDLGWSRGMREAHRDAILRGQHRVFRRMPSKWPISSPK